MRVDADGVALVAALRDHVRRVRAVVDGHREARALAGAGYSVELGRLGVELDRLAADLAHEIDEQMALRLAVRQARRAAARRA